MSSLARDEAPPPRMRGAAVDEHEAGLGALAPAQVMNRAALDFDVAIVVRRGERFVEPLGRDTIMRRIVHGHHLLGGRVYTARDGGTSR